MSPSGTTTFGPGTRDYRPWAASLRQCRHEDVGKANSGLDRTHRRGDPGVAPERLGSQTAETLNNGYPDLIGQCRLTEIGPGRPPLTGQRRAPQRRRRRAVACRLTLREALIDTVFVHSNISGAR
jgi:hypothetical protein